MADQVSSDVKLEIGHVLFIDIVGYSKLLITDQSELLQKLKEIVWGTEQFRLAQAEGKLMRLPTGDGGALVFRNDPEAPVLCAMEISKELKRHPELQVRMGIHSGPVNEITDLNAQANIAGAGINIAQRIMDCGDAGHILLSRHVAEDLEQYPRWRSLLHDLGECEVKHGVRIGVVNLSGDGVGNAATPKKFETIKKHRAHVRWATVAVALLVLGTIVGGTFYLSHRSTTSALRVLDKSIAVLPFENLSRDPDNAFFTDGVQDEILTDLSKIADLKVISRTSVMQYKTGMPRNLREIGQQLGVAHVVEGSVQRAANKVRVIAQLIDARNDAHLWAQTYDRDLADVFAIQSEIAKAIADQLQAKLSPNEKKAIEQPPTTDLAAFELYSRAKTLVLTAGLSATGEPDEGKAIGQQEEGLRNLERAAELDPRNFNTLQQIALSYQALGRYAETIAALDRASAIVPDNAETRANRELFYLCWKADTRPLRQTIDAILAQGPGAIASAADTWFFCALAERDPAAAERALVALGDNPWLSNESPIILSHSFGEGLLARMTKDEARARTAFEAARVQQEKIVQAQPDYGPALCVLGLIDAALGRKDLALDEGRRAIALTPLEKDVINGSRVLQYFAITAAWAGEKEVALQQLEAGLRAPFASLMLSYGALKLFPVWDPLRGDPRFEKIVASLAPKCGSGG